MEKTFTIIKPNATIAGNTGNIIQLLEHKDFNIIEMKMVQLTRKQAEGFYAEHKDKAWFDELIDFMTSSKITAMVLERENAVLFLRDVVGATNPEDAKEGTIRKMYAKNVAENAIHASDSIESANREIEYFFPA